MIRVIVLDKDERERCVSAILHGDVDGLHELLLRGANANAVVEGRPLLMWVRLRNGFQESARSPVYGSGSATAMRMQKLLVEYGADYTVLDIYPPLVAWQDSAYRLEVLDCRKKFCYKWLVDRAIVFGQHGRGLVLYPLLWTLQWLRPLASDSAPMEKDCMAVLEGVNACMRDIYARREVH